MTAAKDSTKRDINPLKEGAIQGETGDSSSHSKSRRTLLKGAAAIPVIMTLPSGVAVAMGSTCVARDQQLAADTQPAWITGSKDTWVRKAVTARMIQLDGASDDAFWVYQPDPNIDDWLNENDMHFTTQSDNQMEDEIGTTYSIVEGDTTQYIIAQVDEEGRVVGFGFTTAFNHITGSCWSSVNPITAML